MEILPEQPGDEAAIAAVIAAAFGGDLEARLVDRLRTEKELVLSLVAREAGEIVGHVGFARADLRPESRDTAWLVPLSVAPERQGHGIGSVLVCRGLDECRAAGFEYAVVVGDEDYYSRFGFTTEAARALHSRWSDGLMALALVSGAAPLSGALVEPGSFSILD